MADERNGSPVAANSLLSTLRNLLVGDFRPSKIMTRDARHFFEIGHVHWAFLINRSIIQFNA
jgi:hypothetical protein